MNDLQASFPNNDVEYYQMLALNQCRTSGSMMYKNDGGSPEEQYNLQPLFQSSLIDHQAHQNYYNGSITMNGNGKTTQSDVVLCMHLIRNLVCD